ncbi:putative receptor-like protein kinase [Morus notabilis]|uniref:Putative receptor-like protein kinase n=1 Tax=Morus notabilis TaxID=981085 RepID=W9RBX0_9ROSA|nr:probable receptor-like protein kinase At2g23200 [Morus notabilis]EXB81598.1 putative receptor-like protein kinase [Morus notabilis]
MLHFPPFLLLLILKLSSLELIISSNYSKPDKYFINCGSNSNTNISDDRIFVGDPDPPFSLSFGRSKDVKDTNPSNNTPSLYRTARFSDQPFSYEIQLSSHNKTTIFVVRLHFFSFSTPRINLSAAVFDVSTSGLSLLSNFSVGNRTNTALIEEFLVTVKEGLFSLCFVPSQKLSPLAFVNAIEVFPTPDNFISDSASLVTSLASNSSNKSYTGLLSFVLHPVLRINVGGSNITPGTDTLWRSWIPDDDFIFNKEAANNRQSDSGALSWQDGITEYTAPESVYRTAKVLNVDSNFSNMSWDFPVSKTIARHLVRVHFCDIISKSSANFLEFNLSILGKFGRLVNPFNETKEIKSPFYHDFVVDSNGSRFINVRVSKLGDFSSTDSKPFLNGLEIFEMQNKPGIVLRHNQVKKKNKNMVAGLCVACVVLVGILVSVFLLFKRRKAKPDRTTKLNLNLLIPYGDILRATRKFDEKLVVGEGGFGKVYKGNLKGKNVAVKRGERGHGTVKRGELDQGQGLHEFESEIRVLSQIRHKHLVSLIGYCDDKCEMIIVYEFMEMGTLREHLYDTKSKAQKPSKKPKLSWEKRLEICIGAAKGLNYLHTSSSEVIIHRDVKSTNILLDENYVAKVADFGLSKAGPPDPNNESIDLKGSFGYFDPEYISSSQYTVKSDVYSFGVVLLEVLCARPAIFTLSEEQDNVSLAKWWMPWRRKGQLEKIIDPLLVGEINPKSLRVVGNVAEMCLKESGSERPTMQEVEWHLTYALQLQRNETTEGPFQDTTTTNASLESALGMPSYTFHFGEDVDDDETFGVSGYSITTSGQPFLS